MKNLITNLKESGEDFEFYPTSLEMIEPIYNDLLEWNYCKVLDIGCGNGNFFTKFAEIGNKVIIREKFAIEKSEILISKMPADIIILGTDFWENTLIDKKVGIIFSNPPYSQFEDWAEKIILEGNCKQIYLVIPERWKNSDRIANALKLRGATASNIGSFDFLDAERAARAKVEIVKIIISTDYNSGRDPFNVWFDQNFKFEEMAKFGREEREKEIKNELEAGQNLIEILANLYSKEFEKLINNYKTICSLDLSVLKELEVSIYKIEGGLKQKIEGLKYTYWRRLFDGLGSLTNRLTEKSRQEMLDKIFNNSTIDFTISNAYAVVIWAIKNANLYFDKQLKEVYLSLTETEYVKKYKSNQRTWEQNMWRYKYSDEKGCNTHYSLDYRVITHAGIGGSFNKDIYQSILINDVNVIARNLGFDYIGDVKSFKNGNVHFRFEKEFIKAFNIEAARLFAWIKSKEEAVQEFDESCEISKEDVAKFYGRNLTLSQNCQLLLD
jgi:SAM-dependent methyltransferase